MDWIEFTLALTPAPSAGERVISSAALEIIGGSVAITV